MSLQTPRVWTAIAVGSGALLVACGGAVSAGSDDASSAGTHGETPGDASSEVAVPDAAPDASPDAAAEGGAHCVVYQSTTVFSVNVVTYVIDRSRTMGALAPNSSMTLAETVAKSISRLHRPLDWVGLVTFPSAAGCFDGTGGLFPQIDSDEHHQSMLDQLAEPVSGNDDTPLQQALARAFEDVTSAAALVDERDFVRRFVVLLTDGEFGDHSCGVAADELLASVQTATQSGIELVVVALPGSATDAPLLSEFDGGYNHFSEGAPAPHETCLDCAIANTLDTTLGSGPHWSCAFPVSGVEASILGGAQIVVTLRDDSSRILDPSEYRIDDSDDSVTIELIGTACEDVQHLRRIEAIAPCDEAP